MPGDLCDHGMYRPWLQRGLCRECEKDCNCADMLAAGAGRWWCPAHKDFTRPPQYAVDAVAKLSAKYLAAANELFELKRTRGVAASCHQPPTPSSTDGEDA